MQDPWGKLSFMIFKVFRNLAVGAVCALIAAGAAAKNSKDSADESLLGAYDAYRAGDPIKLARDAKKVDGHVLVPWLDYWRLSTRREGIADRAVGGVVVTHPSM